MIRFGFKTHYQTWELRAMRLLFAVLVFHKVDRPPVAAQPHPHGVAQYLDLSFLADPGTFAVLQGLLLVCLALFVWGKWMFPSLSYMLALSVGAESLIQSQGNIHHARQIIALTILAMWLAYGLGPWLWRRGSPWRRPGLSIDDLAIYWVHQMIAAAYVVSGVSKLLRSGIQLAPLVPQWLLDVQYMPIQITKTHHETYFSALDPSVLERSEQLAGFFAAHPDLCRIFFSGGLFLELFAFLLLINRAWATVMGVCLYVLHELIGFSMDLYFLNNQWVIVAFLVNVPYLAVAVLRRVRAGAATSRRP